ncbi:MAG: amino acid adenylation domain-containing protein [Pseudoxanthomonas sp.]
MLVSNKSVAGGAAYGERFALTDAQAEKWLGGHYSAKAALAFGESFELVFEGPLDGAALSAAIAEIAIRHEALAMRFDPEGSAQIYEPPSKVRLEQLDFSAEADPEAAYRAHCARCARDPFDPADPPLVRAHLCRLATGSHRVLLMGHHLLFDGWSLRVVLKELSVLYSSQLRQTPLFLPPADSWSAYVEAEHERREGEVGRECLRFWMDRFASLPEPLRIPTDRPRTAEIDFAASNISMDVEPELWKSLRDTARSMKVSRFTLLLAGYFLLLHRVTGQDDLVCGVPFAGAAQGSGFRMVGDTDNTLPLRMRIDGEESLDSFVLRVRDELALAAQHQDISLGRIVDALNITREAGRLMLVETIVNLNPSMEKLRFEGVDCRLHVLPRSATAWEFAFFWMQKPSQLTLEVQYQSALHDESSIQGWVDSYLDILCALVDNDSRQVALQALALPCDPRDFSLVNARIPAGADAMSLPALLEEAFLLHPTRLAAQCAGAETTYAELDQQTHRLASALVALGMGAGQMVGIALPRTLDMLHAVIAVMRAGAAYVPLDPGFPEHRLLHMADHAGLTHIITSPGAELPAQLLKGRTYLSVEDLLSEAAGQEDALPLVLPSDLAYVLYTSGSTGEPKGVRVLHGNLVNFLCSMRESPGFSADDVICAATTLSFDIAALELYLPLICGGRVVIADDNEHRDPEAMCRLIADAGCTVLQTTPSLVSLVQEVGRMEALAPLRLFVGGEAMPISLARSLAPQCRELWNMYGPTETTVWSSIHRVFDGADAVPLGRPIAQTRLYVLDKQRRPSLPHTLGEIWIGGAGVADGYLHRADLTQERFLSDPFVADGSRMYRTGDLGRIHGGELHFHGRADEQIKIRGFRIEPGEIEAVAALEPGVVECVAVARPLQDGDLVLALYIGSDESPGDMVTRLRKRLMQSLPGYMRPQYLVVLPTLPKTPNGKIDRQSLPTPETHVQVSPRRRIGPRYEVESFLCEQWNRLLRRDDIGVDDDFFELGGYSLLAVRMFVELHERYGVDLPLATLIERPTIAALAEMLPRPSQAIAAAAQSIGEHAVREWRPLVTLRKGDARPPIFLFHAVGGNVLNYMPLLETLDPLQSVFGLQSAGLDGYREPSASIEEMADLYVAEIMTVDPQGPYMLAGGSMGGLLALEVGRRLVEYGHEVAMLAMFDTYGPDMAGTALLRRFNPQRWWKAYFDMGSDERRDFWRRMQVRLGGTLFVRIREWFAGGSELPQQDARLRRVEMANHRALARYVPKRYEGNMQLFRTSNRHAGDDGALGWRRWIAGNIEIVELPGRHNDFIDQPELAAQLRLHIDAVTGRQGT